MPITPLPTPPSRNDPTNFAARADAFLGALPTFQTEANALEVAVDADAVSAAASAVTAVNAVTAAQAAAAGAAAAANVTKWVSGTTYTEGAVVWSPITYLSYRRKSTGGGTTDPSADSANWAQTAGTGDVTLAGTETLTNKTINIANNTLTGVQPTLVSGTNIKTLNGGSLLGSGNIVTTSGALTLLSTVTASNSATVDIETTFNSTYISYVIEAVDILPSNAAAVDLYCRLKISGAYDTDTNYNYITSTSNSAISPQAISGGPGTFILLAQSTQVVSNATCQFTMSIKNTTSTTKKKVISWIGAQSLTGNHVVYLGGAGINANTGALTGVRIFAASGNITSGVFRLYGLSN